MIYRPDSELASHYFEAVLPRQFDEYIWIDRTSAVKPLDVAELQGCRTLIRSESKHAGPAVTVP